jgi:predicted Kef-type K+ transport protein
MKNFVRSPLVGQGWIDSGNGTANLMSIYMQTLAELGVIGMAILIVVLVILAGRAWRLRAIVRRYHFAADVGYLAIGLMVSILAHGAFESGDFMGSTINALLLGFSVGLLDRLPDLIVNAVAVARRRAAQASFVQPSLETVPR